MKKKRQQITRIIVCDSYEKTAHKNNPYINTALKTKINKTNTTKTLENVNETKYVWQKRRSQEPKKPNKKKIRARIENIYGSGI